MERTNNNIGNVNHNILPGDNGCIQLPSREGKSIEKFAGMVARGAVLLIAAFFNKNKIVKEETSDRGGCFGTGDMSNPETYTPDA